MGETAVLTRVVDNRKVLMLVSHCPHALDLVTNSWIVVIMNIL